MAKNSSAPSDVDRIVNAIEALTAEVKAMGDRMAKKAKPVPKVKRKGKRETTLKA
jgi:hypothetical protein